MKRRRTNDACITGGFGLIDRRTMFNAISKVGIEDGYESKTNSNDYSTCERLCGELFK